MMPRLKNRTPSYRLHKPSGQAIVSLNGQSFYLGRFGSPASRASYDRLVSEWLANGRRLPASEDNAPCYSVVELAAAYWKYCEGYYRSDGKPTSELAYIRDSLRVLKQLYGNTPADEFRPSKFMACQRVMIDARLARSVVNGRVRRIRRCFKWAVSREMIPVAVYQSLATVEGLKRGRSDAKETPRVLPVPEEYVASTLLHLSPQVRAMCELQLLTGMRPGEVRIMRSRDFDTTGRTWVYTPSTHKTMHIGRERRIYMGPRAQTVLAPFLRPDTTSFLFSPRDAVDQQNSQRRAKRKSPMTPSQAKRRRKRNPKRAPRNCYDKNSHSKAIQRGCDAADVDAKKAAGLDPAGEGRIVPRWTANQLRHNAATRFRKEFGLEVSQIMLGHSSPETTLIYAERDEERAMSVVGKIG